MSKKITQAAARQTRRELKELQERFSKYVHSLWPGKAIRQLPLDQGSVDVLNVASRLGHDTVVRMEEKDDKKILVIYAVRRP